MFPLQNKHLKASPGLINSLCCVSSLIAPGMLPGFPPGIFPFWGPFPAVPPPPPAAAVAAPGATDAPQSSTEATQAAGKGTFMMIPCC